MYQADFTLQQRLKTALNLVIKAFLARSFLWQLIAICISFAKEILAAKWRSIDSVSFISTIVGFLYNLINFTLNSCTLVLSKQQELQSYCKHIYIYVHRVQGKTQTARFKIDLTLQLMSNVQISRTSLNLHSMAPIVVICRDNSRDISGDDSCDFYA